MSFTREVVGGCGRYKFYKVVGGCMSLMIIIIILILIKTILLIIIITVTQIIIIIIIIILVIIMIMFILSTEVRLFLGGCIKLVAQQ